MEIWKYELEIKDTQQLSIPSKAKMLTVETIRNSPWLFVLVNPLAEKIRRTIRVYDTEDTIKAEDNGKYVGTYQQDNGIFVFHIFDEGVTNGS